MSRPPIVVPPTSTRRGDVVGPEIRAKQGFKLVCLADVKPERVDWVWPGYLARGKLTLIGGDPGQGKSLVTIDAASRISRGEHWPQGPRAPVGSSLFLCSEDGVADTIRPRAEAAGADLGFIQIFESTLIKAGKRKTFNLQEDLDMLGKAIRHIGNVRFVCVDAITSYMGLIDSHQTTNVRAVLEPVAAFAEDHGVSFLGVTHPPKAAQGNALRAFTGSFAFVAAARVAFMAVSDPETDRHLLLAVKNNIGLKAPGRGYHISTKVISNDIEAPCILWDDEPVDMTADQALAAASIALKEGDARSDAKAFLRDLLGDGPVDATEGEEAAEANGITKRTLARARKDLGVIAKKKAFEDGWQWSLP